MKYLCGYRVVAEIASGGFSTVYKVQETTPPYRYFAAKRFNRLTDYNIFLQEASSLAQVQDIKSTQHLFRAICDKDHLILLTDYIEGHSLKTQIREQGVMSEQEALNTLLTLGKQVAEIHLHGLLHLDIKPSNILISDSNEIILTDFGVASPLCITRNEVVKTDFCYTAPEKYQGRQSTASDVYSLGASLLYLLTGKTPFPNTEGSSDAYQMLAHCTETIPAPDTLSETTKDLLKKMLSKQETERHTLPELIQHTRQLLDTPLPTKPAKPEQRRQTIFPSERQCFATAAEAGTAFAQYRYALLIEDEKPETAQKWYEAAANQGFSRAQNNLALLRKKLNDTKAAIHWYHQGAKNNNPYCQFNLSRELRKQNKQEEADAWLTKAANNGHERAQNSLAIKLEEQQALEEAFTLYQHAAYLGLPAAQYNLGLMYESRQTPDTSKAEELATFWLERAAQAGHLRAQKKLAR